MAHVYSKEYQAEKKREQRERAKEIYKFHGWEKMPNETDKEFRRRFTKRIVIVTDSEIKILDAFGKEIKPTN